MPQYHLGITGSYTSYEIMTHVIYDMLYMNLRHVCNGAIITQFGDILRCTSTRKKRSKIVNDNPEEKKNGIFEHKA